MKGGHNPTVRQAKLLTKDGKDYTQWLTVKVERNQITFKHKTSNEIVTISTQ